MQVKILKGKLVILNADEFDLKKSLECGQIFRYQIDGNKFTVFETDNKFVCTKKNDQIEIETNKAQRAINYFDLQTDYSVQNARIKKMGKLFSEACEFGKGIRLFKQNPLEMIISFVISANNNIPRIKKSLFKLCELYGERKQDYFAFPTLDDLCKISKQQWQELGVGYRAESLVKLCHQLEGIDLNALDKIPTQSLRAKLISLAGIGPKVADCVLLFAFGRRDSFPTDTWIKKIYNENMGGSEDDAKKISKILSDKFGQDSGLVQQYLFYYKREKGDKQ